MITGRRSVSGTEPDFHITDNIFGTSIAGSSSQHNYSVVVLAGASNRYVITGNSMLNNINASLLDQGAGPKKLVTNNLLQ
jgi:hypothetical protein